MKHFIDELTNYEAVYNTIVESLTDYVNKNNLKSLVLGISGGIDSSVCAVICREVSRRTGCKFIGRSLTIWNKHDEFTTAANVGSVFCNDFQEVHLGDMFSNVEQTIVTSELEFVKNESKQITIKDLSNSIALGNIQARLRMIYLYHLAGVNHGIVIDTDNLTENMLGFYTIHGDQGDFKPIGNLWKMEVYGLAKWMLNNVCKNDEEKVSLNASINIVPTDGLGITKSDVDQFGADSYEQVDYIFHSFFNYVSNKYPDIQIERDFIDVLDKNEVSELINDFIKNVLKLDIFKEIAKNVLSRLINSRFKRLDICTVEISNE